MTTTKKTTESKVPTQRLTLEWPAGLAETEKNRDIFNEQATQKIISFGKKLRAKGERAWFEVWYAGFPGRADTTEADFDAVEVDENGNIITLPPYEELTA